MLINNRFVTGVTYPLMEDKVRRGWLVQRAYDRTLRRDVVLKSVPAGTARELQELADEDDMLRRVRSPYVVSSYGLVSSSHPARTHLVVELFSEDTVERLIQRHGGTLDMDRSLRITVHLLEAFEALHRAGVIHRDLHPKHISYRDRDHLKLFDLGLALGGPGAEESLVAGPRATGLFSRLAGKGDGTGTARLAVRNTHHYGTWEMMAPEEFTVGAPITPAANVYSAGMLLYRMLEGYYPLAYGSFDWGSARPTLDEMRAIQRDLHLRQPVPFSGGLDPHVRACLRTALSKRPGDRYPSAREFREDLAAAVHSE